MSYPAQGKERNLDPDMHVHSRAGQSENRHSGSWQMVTEMVTSTTKVSVWGLLIHFKPCRALASALNG